MSRLVITKKMAAKDLPEDIGEALRGLSDVLWGEHACFDRGHLIKDGTLYRVYWIDPFEYHVSPKPTVDNHWWFKSIQRALKEFNGKIYKSNGFTELAIGEREFILYTMIGPEWHLEEIEELKEQPEMLNRIDNLISASGLLEDEISPSLISYIKEAGAVVLDDNASFIDYEARHGEHLGWRILWPSIQLNCERDNATVVSKNDQGEYRFKRPPGTAKPAMVMLQSAIKNMKGAIPKLSKKTDTFKKEPKYFKKNNAGKMLPKKYTPKEIAIDLLVGEARLFFIEESRKGTIHSTGDALNIAFAHFDNFAKTQIKLLQVQIRRNAIAKMDDLRKIALQGKVSKAMATAKVYPEEVTDSLGLDLALSRIIRDRQTKKADMFIDKHVDSRIEGQLRKDILLNLRNWGETMRLIDFLLERQTKGLKGLSEASGLYTYKTLAYEQYAFSDSLKEKLRALIFSHVHQTVLKREADIQDGSERIPLKPEDVLRDFCEKFIPRKKKSAEIYNERLVGYINQVDKAALLGSDTGDAQSNPEIKNLVKNILDQVYRTGDAIYVDIPKDGRFASSARIYLTNMARVFKDESENKKARKPRNMKAAEFKSIMSIFDKLWSGLTLSKDADEAKKREIRAEVYRIVSFELSRKANYYDSSIYSRPRRTPMSS